MSTIFREVRTGQAAMQRGFAMVSAIFLLVILAALGAFMLTFSIVQHTTAATDLEGSRAYQAARAGIEWAAYQVLDPGNTTVASAVLAPPYGTGAQPFPNFPGCPAVPFPMAGFAGTNLAGFNVVVGCTPSDHTEGSMNVRVYQLTSTATGGTGSYAVSRVISASVSKCRDPDAPAPYEC